MAHGNGNGSLYGKTLSTGWLATRLGIGSARVDVLRRSGELFGFQPPGGQGYLYPSWQFGPDGKVLPIVPRLVAAARREGIDDRRLFELMSMRIGLGGHRRVCDLVRDGDEEGVLRVIRSARTAAA